MKSDFDHKKEHKYFQRKGPNPFIGVTWKFLREDATKDPSNKDLFKNPSVIRINQTFKNDTDFTNNYIQHFNTTDFNDNLIHSHNPHLSPTRLKTSFNYISNCFFLLENT